MMHRLPYIALALALLVPAAVEAQPRFMVAGGFTAPTGSLSDVADAGYHGQVGLFVSIPTTPLGLRGDGFFHRLGSPDAVLEDTQILGGTLSVVYDLPGIGLVPYLLAGLGSYQVEAGPVGATVKSSDTGYHGGFGVNIGAGTGVSAFAEIRYIKIGGGSDATLIPLTFGLKL
ncbi:MAG: outer membrane beta-barrel protein [Longimicrobiales bacterium]|nr:outer membrane beta-barrel protein [Longimicrobiales bacterium]